MYVSLGRSLLRILIAMRQHLGQLPSYIIHIWKWVCWNGSFHLYHLIVIRVADKRFLTKLFHGLLGTVHSQLNNYSKLDCRQSRQQSLTLGHEFIAASLVVDFAA